MLKHLSLKYWCTFCVAKNTGGILAKKTKYPSCKFSECIFLFLVLLYTSKWRCYSMPCFAARRRKTFDGGKATVQIVTQDSGLLQVHVVVATLYWFALRLPRRYYIPEISEKLSETIKKESQKSLQLCSFGNHKTCSINIKSLGQNIAATGMRIRISFDRRD